MSDTEPADPDTPAEEILCATYRALCRHGYADLTMQDIADESDLSKAALHYHYDTKQDLLLAFLDHLYEEFVSSLAVAGGDPVERLVETIDVALSPPRRDDDREFRTAVLELKAQAPYEPAYREKLEAFDDLLHETVREAVAEAIEAGVFRDVNPDETASFVVTVINGAQTRHVSVGAPIDETRSRLVAYVTETLVAGDGREPERADTAGSDGEEDPA
jgi:AcrR family transcriptional regulator